MNQVIFFDWLLKFDAYISQTRDRTVLLLVDNASSHGDIRTLPTLQNVRFRYLPPNTTSILQTLDAGLIAALKSEYRKKIVTRSLALVEQNATEFYRREQLTVMQWIDHIWTELDPSFV